MSDVVGSSSFTPGVAQRVAEWTDQVAAGDCGSIATARSLRGGNLSSADRGALRSSSSSTTHPGVGHLAGHAPSASWSRPRPLYGMEAAWCLDRCLTRLADDPHHGPARGGMDRPPAAGAVVRHTRQGRPCVVVLGVADTSSGGVGRWPRGRRGPPGRARGPMGGHEGDRGSRRDPAVG
jgi:hypothetical protein